MKAAWTREDVLALGVKTDVPTAGAILGDLCKDEAYRMVKRGDFPVPVIKVGRKLFVPTAPILALLHVEPDTETVRPGDGVAGDSRVTRPQLHAIGQ
jgi:hypothetical protein